MYAFRHGNLFLGEFFCKNVTGWNWELLFTDDCEEDDDGDDEVPPTGRLFFLEVYCL